MQIYIAGTPHGERVRSHAESWHEAGEHTVYVVTHEPEDEGGAIYSKVWLRHKNEPGSSRLLANVNMLTGEVTDKR